MRFVKLTNLIFGQYNSFKYWLNLGASNLFKQMKDSVKLFFFDQFVWEEMAFCIVEFVHCLIRSEFVEECQLLNHENQLMNWNETLTRWISLPFDRKAWKLIFPHGQLVLEGNPGHEVSEVGTNPQMVPKAVPWFNLHGSCTWFFRMPSILNKIQSTSERQFHALNCLRESLWISFKITWITEI